MGPAMSKSENLLIGPGLLIELLSIVWLFASISSGWSFELGHILLGVSRSINCLIL